MIWWAEIGPVPGRKILLKGKAEGYSKVCKCPDRSAAEGKAHKELWDQTKEKNEVRAKQGALYRDNKVTSIDKDRMPA